MTSFNGWRRILICFFLCFFILHQLSVLQLRSSNTSDDFSLKNRVKFDHVVLGPAAGQGLPNRLQCQGVKALNKTQLWTPRSPRIENGISFVTVFTLYNASPTNLVDQRSSRSVMVGNASYSKPQRSMAILNVFINFIQVTMPKSNVIILTDPASELRLRSEVAVVHPIPGDYSRENLMLQRIKSYIAFLEQRVQAFLEQRVEQQSLRLGTHYIFTDSDMAVVDDLEQIFVDYDNFHVALTFRNNKEQPLNSGIIAVRGTHEGIERALKFLREVLDVYRSKYMNASRMLGDQLALAWIVKSSTSFDARRFRKAQAFIEVVGDTSVLFLPCATYNWTPPEGAGQFHGMPLDVKVIHFKGSRKRLLLEAWNFLNSSSNISDMLCLILKSGRTKYDF